MRSFDPMRNPDGSLCVFRVACLSILAVCMLAYASLSMLGCSDTSDRNMTKVETGTQSVTSKEENQTQEPVTDNTRAQALRALSEAASYYRECGAINKGFEGCVFEFPASVLKYYDSKAQAADDGFSVSLKSREPDDCMLFETDVTGTVRAYDAQGKISEKCLR